MLCYRMVAQAEVHPRSADSPLTGRRQYTSRPPSTPRAAASYNYAYVDDDDSPERYHDWPEEQRRYDDLEDMGYHDTHRRPPATSEPLSVISGVDRRVQPDYSTRAGPVHAADVHRSLNDTFI